MASSTTEYIKTKNLSLAKRGFLLSGLEKLLNSTQDFFAHSKIGFVQNTAKSTVLDTLKHLKRGELEIHTADEVYNFGAPYTLEGTDGPPNQLKAKITVNDDSFWMRLFMHADFGFADAYMLQHIDVDNLNNVFRIFVLNRKNLGELHSVVTPLLRFVSYVSNMRLANKLIGSKSNISAHYDLSNEVFGAFLSWDMTYSCAVFDEEAKGCTGDLWEERPIAPPRTRFDQQERSAPPDDLERGQLEKLHLIAKKARITPGSRVLEIGCGWGSFAILAARTYGATVDAITISEVQKIAIDQIVEAEGLSDKISVHVMDYRKLPKSFHQAFDSVVSIGVMEHVGVEFMEGWFKQMSWAMKPENSFKVFTMSTVPDTRWHMYSTEVDFVRKYIYPGGQLSSIKTLVDDACAAGLNIESIENIGPHYARTLREWSYRFCRNYEAHIKPALLKTYPELTENDLEIFRRKWIYYFAYSEAGFALRSISDSVFVLTREANLRIL